MFVVKPTNRKWIDSFRHTIEDGGVVIFPSDSSYGIAVDATNEDAIQKVFDLKKRDGKPLSIIVKDIEQAKTYAQFSQDTEDLWARLIPGQVTLILPKLPSLPNSLTCNQSTIGIRIPDNEITRKLSHAIDVPYTATSANLSGQPSCYSVDEVLLQIDESLIDLVINAGTLPPNPASTVIDTTVDPPVVLRKGPVALPSFMT
ncbi:threonylcarbamoyl-AMP synthase [candidate division WWE3 bacterium CG_4_9_14_3_um_filter_39_7]|uniref:L-threonylcarbamoyladenylate synthase n=1 Tax=candidate division WWE3 bacterium CG_4_9_14_3_um_filter_39_7 TaxID=1975080 RepID=A0A2M7X1B0_UNCKA|nr:MAG: threonylcarbamoyl-AMP synthase [candidate division WWE3 bacterium CG_4_9_14_3_um_filter_39_7]